MLPRIVISTFSLRGNRLKSSQWTGCPSLCTTPIIEHVSRIMSCCHRRGGLKPFVKVPQPARHRALSHPEEKPGPTAIPIPPLEWPPPVPAPQHKAPQKCYKAHA